MKILIRILFYRYRNGYLKIISNQHLPKIIAFKQINKIKKNHIPCIILHKRRQSSCLSGCSIRDFFFLYYHELFKNVRGWGFGSVAWVHEFNPKYKEKKKLFKEVTVLSLINFRSSHELERICGGT